MTTHAKTMETRSVVAITERLNSIAFLTDDEWLVSEDEDVEEYEVYIPHPHPNVRTVICHSEQNRALADFLAATPMDIQWLLTENERLRDLLHRVQRRARDELGIDF
jgi:hypothetical protein